MSNLVANQFKVVLKQLLLMRTQCNHGIGQREQQERGEIGDIADGLTEKLFGNHDAQTIQIGTGGKMVYDVAFADNQRLTGMYVALNGVDRIAGVSTFAQTHQNE